METGWLHMVIPCTEEHMDATGSRISQLLFLLLFENMNPSGISQTTAEPQTRGYILPDLHWYRPWHL